MESYLNPRLNDHRKELFFSGLASLLSAGLNFSYSFELLIAGESDRKIKALYMMLYQQVVRGHCLWKSLELSGRFGSLDYGVIRIGEETGKLDQALLFLTDYYRKQIARKRMIKGAVSYPVIILLTAIAVLIFMLTVIVPMFEQVYARMGGELPGITRSIIAFSRTFPSYLLATGMVALATAGVAALWGKTDAFQSRWCTLLLRLPVAGAIIRKNYQTRFCKLLYLLTSSGVPLIRGIEMLREIISFYPYRQSFAVIGEGLRQGQLFADNMSRFPAIYDRKLVTLLRVGEETNRLGEMLHKQAEELTLDLEHRIRQLGNLLEPVLILGIGSIVALVLISMYLPMFKLGSTIG